MYFAFTEEQEEFRASLRRLLTERAPSARVREVLDAGHDPMLWKLLVQDMGLPGLHVPEEYGGQGFGYLETAVVFQELGRALAPVPMAASTFAIEAILRCGTEEQRRSLLPGLASGERIGALAVTGARPDDAVRVDGDRLHGKVNWVAHGHVADVLVVPADGGLYVVEKGAPGLTVERVDSLDLTRPVSTLVLEGVPAQRLGADGVERVLDVARTLLAFEALGAAEQCLDISVEYAKTRVQFNRPIGSFQGIKHLCAEMAIEIDASLGAAMYAAMILDEDPVEFAQVATLAKAQAAETVRQCAEGMIQVHGGIGFTWEHDSHLYYRRAKAIEVWLGGVTELRDLLADRVGI
ncbi:acyl-CoA dehydrogenase [Amycolatopsis acidicola]|uniref:Acyl-CoA dehydrogenase n=1 Tax=Amycolatopsis acidicola TaxID=2596893 RepID=A0A5N0UPM6_9PSEU|nr:acyl-CoA dehydrogenase family protein [Amycolatopsis acidicola]KAA9150217.1 acyl-CoA dehydrogenase [Amycolatopsis acidicola]